jgi:hypothetical protein
MQTSVNIFVHRKQLECVLELTRRRPDTDRSGCFGKLQPAKFAGPLGALATVIGAVVLVGYWYGTPLLYGGHTIPVAFSTACGFFLSGIAIVMAAGAAGWPLREFLGDSHSRGIAARVCAPDYRCSANQWLD